MKELLVGTRKGLWTLSSDDRTTWTVGEPALFGQIVQHAVVDPRDGRRALVAAAHRPPRARRSCGRRTAAPPGPRRPKPPAFASGDRLGRALTTVFWLTPGHADEPGAWYAGGASPQGLFRTDDGGDTWEPVTGWNDHPMWETWCEWPEENTPDGSMLHSVHRRPARSRPPLPRALGRRRVREHRRRRRLGARSTRAWRPTSSPTRPGVRPRPPHRAPPPADPDRLYQQNHCGIYRLDRPEVRWTRIGDDMPREIGDIGFPIELHPRDPDTAWVFPMDGTDVWPRTSVDGRPAAYVTRDAGASWDARRPTGLPDRAWFTVKRQAMTTDDDDPVGVYFGTTSGEVWASGDEGASWALHRPAPAGDLLGRGRLIDAGPHPDAAALLHRTSGPWSGRRGDGVGGARRPRPPASRASGSAMVDEQNRLRQHMKIWIGQDPVTDLVDAASADGRESRSCRRSAAADRPGAPTVMAGADRNRSDADVGGRSRTS